MRWTFMAGQHIFLILLVTSVVGAASTADVNEDEEEEEVASERPKIRIAHLISDVMPSTPLRYLMRHLDVPNRSLLPDYDIVIRKHRFRPSDDQHCSFVPCRSKCNRDAVEDAQVTLMGILGNDTRSHHAVTGPFLRQEVLDVVKLTGKARLLHVHGGDLPILSDRTVYPYSFRSVRSLQGVMTVMFHIASINAWRSVVSVWWAQDLWDTSNLIAMRWNITNHPRLSEDGARDWAVDVWQANLVDFIRSSRIRVLFANINQGTGWQLVCRLYRSQLSGMQLFIDETWLPGWLLAEHDPALGDCSPDEMYSAAGGYVRVTHPKASPGIAIQGAGVAYPPNGGDDQSQLPLTCMPHLTAHTFYNSGEQYRMALTEGFITGDISAERYFAIASRTVEAICATLVALHDAIYKKGVLSHDIRRREASAFNKLTKSMGEVDFQGPTGRFRYHRGSGDPEYTYLLISQEAVAGRQNSSYHNVAVASFPADSPEGTPAISMLDEEHLPFIWQDGSTGLGPKPHLGLYPDCALVKGVLVWDSCQPCSPGEYYSSRRGVCKCCPRGRFQNQSGMSGCIEAEPGWYVVDEELPSAIAECPAGHQCPQHGTVTPLPCVEGRYAAERGQQFCDLCPAGRFQNATSASDCTVCPKGHECPQSGTLEPRPCTEGKYARGPGASSCSLCETGSYQDEIGATTCKSCDSVVAGSSTRAIATISRNHCVCDEGWFRGNNSDHCSPCPEGMFCPHGSDMRHLSRYGIYDRHPFPKVERGFMTMTSAPLTVYRCAHERLCLGGNPGSCSGGHDPSAIACGTCPVGFYSRGERCEECGKASSLPLITTCFLGVAAVAVITIVINKNSHKTPASSMMIVAVACLLFTSLQTMGVFGSMDVPWEEPVRSILNVLKLVSFELDMLKVACVLGANPLRSFMLRQMLPLLVVPVILPTLLLKKYLPKFGSIRTHIWVELSNSMGTFYTVFFISILLSAVTPFVCYKHPGDGGESVQSAPSVICFQGGDHTTMIIIGVISLLFVPIPLCALCAYAVVMYPSKIKLHSSDQFLLATRFLFFRYVPQRYYFQMIVLLRSALLCLIPAVLRGHAATQVLLLSIVLGIYIVVADALRPWRITHCNVLDATLGQLLVTLVLCGGLFLPDSPHQYAVTLLTTTIIVCIFLCATVTLAYALWQRLAPAYYHYFICHHKAHAAAQARYLKILLRKKRRNMEIFIDSDNLQELDNLFDIVRSRVRHLVVFLTADTLKRPWCVGEIVTALRASLSVTRVCTQSFLVPSDEQCACPDTYVDASGCNLSEYGIQWTDVTHALSVFLGPSIPQLNLMQTTPGTPRFEHVAALLLKQRVAEKEPPTLSQVPSHGVLIITDPLSDEANASAGILVEHAGPDVYRACEHSICLLCDHEHNLETALQASMRASVAIVVLSPGCLESFTVLSIICELMSAHCGEMKPAVGPAMISVNIPGFEFPSPHVVDRLCKDFPDLDVAYNNSAADYVSAFFKRISISLPTHASQQALDAQSEEVLHRIHGNLKKKSCRYPSAESNTSTRIGSPIGAGAGTLDTFRTTNTSQFLEGTMSSPAQSRRLLMNFTVFGNAASPVQSLSSRSVSLSADGRSVGGSLPEPVMYKVSL